MSNLKDPRQPGPTQQVSAHTYYQLIHTLRALLPPPLADTPEALHIRNQAAIARIAAMAPVNADEADLAAHCVAATGQAEDAMRLIRSNADDVQSVMKLNAQYLLLERTALSIHAQLLRVQAARHKREKDNGTSNQGAWAEHIALGLG